MKDGKRPYISFKLFGVLPLSVETAMEPKNRTTKLSTYVESSIAASSVSNTSTDDWSKGFILLKNTHVFMHNHDDFQS